MPNVLCIYHANCADGFTAAWVVRTALVNDAEFFPGVYQQDPPDVTDRDVVIVDFSYKRPVMVDIVAKARSVIVLDHHKSAIEDLGPLAELGPKVAGVLDVERSGAGIAWDYFYPGARRPLLVDYVEDRDLWRFKLPRSRDFSACLFSYPYDFELWSSLAATVENVGGFDLFCDQGRAIDRKHHKDVAELVDALKHTRRIGGYLVPTANLPYTLTSDAGALMAKGLPFAACYWDTPAGRVFSLRSDRFGLDVSKVAAQYGGGGHPNAAGFCVPFDHALAVDPPMWAGKGASK